MPKPTSAVDSARRATPVRVVIVTMDTHLASAAARARGLLARRLPGLTLTVHAASEYSADPKALARCLTDIGQADIVLVAMLFMEEHFQPVLPALRARQAACDAMIGIMSAGEVMSLTRMGRFAMDGSTSGPMALLKRLRGARKSAPGSSGAQQMKMLRRIPQLLRFIPGTAQDVRAYFLTLQYWLAGSDDNMAGLVMSLVDRFADGPRKVLRGTLNPPAPKHYPEIGVYHPDLADRLSERLDDLPAPAQAGQRGCVGLILLRSYLLAGNSGHYDGVIRALQDRGLRVIPAFATGLDARPAIEAFFLNDDGSCRIDALVSLTGFSLVGGPAYNDARAAQDMLARLDVPYLGATPVEFQDLAQWEASPRGLLPVEATMMVAIPELDGATGSMVFGGRPGGEAGVHGHDMTAHAERAAMLAARVLRLVELRRSERARRRVGVVLFNFPPNAGSVGTAAFLSVFESLYNTLAAMQAQGYTVELPRDADALRDRLLQGNAARYGAQANVHALVTADHHVRAEPWLAEIEAQWGPAPGRHQSNGSAIFVLGERFGNVFVGVQPAFGYEGDPMRLLFEHGMAPTHAFCAFYRWLREDFGAHALLHFGTHGALEFMPGKQAGLSSACWPDRLIGEMPNVYLYASNNPSEGAIAKRRSAATLVSYLTPSVTRAGLYRGLTELKASIERWRLLPPGNPAERAQLAQTLQAQAAQLDLAPAEPAWQGDVGAQVAQLANQLLEMEASLIPHGLHVVGRGPVINARVDMLAALAEATHGIAGAHQVIRSLLEGGTPAQALATVGTQGSGLTLAMLDELSRLDRLMCANSEIEGLLHALDGRFIRPAPGGDLLRTTSVLPTGRNLHGFDPFRLPSAHAVRDGQRQAQRLLDRHLQDGHRLPESIAIVLWGTDNLKTEGSPIAQAMALMGASPRFDTYGRLAGAQLIPLAELGRPRIDVVATLSGIFRDLLPLQTRMLAQAALLAASADEPVESNFVRKHALAYQDQHGVDLETAALRVFSNAEGAYGSNVNHLVDASCWSDEDELAEAWSRRKGFAYGCSGQPVQNKAVLDSVLADVELTYQNLDSVEIGVTTIDTYFDTLGGISRAVKRARGTDAQVYIGDQTCSEGTVRTLSEQVSLETRTRTLNPKWYEGMLEHGYEGVRQIEVHVTNTLGWSATTGQVAPWVYQQLTTTFVLDPQMRERLSRLNPTAASRVAGRLLEASQRNYWTPDAAMLAALREAGDELEDRLEGVFEKAAA